MKEQRQREQQEAQAARQAAEAEKQRQASLAAALRSANQVLEGCRRLSDSDLSGLREKVLEALGLGRYAEVDAATPAVVETAAAAAALELMSPPQQQAAAAGKKRPRAGPNSRLKARRAKAAS